MQYYVKKNLNYFIENTLEYLSLKVGIKAQAGENKVSILEREDFEWLRNVLECRKLLNSEELGEIND